MSETMNTEHQPIEINLPWGREALLLAGADSDEIEMLTLQQSLIDDQRKQLQDLQVKLDVVNPMLTEKAGALGVAEHRNKMLHEQVEELTAAVESLTESEDKLRSQVSRQSYEAKDAEQYTVILKDKARLEQELQLVQDQLSDVMTRFEAAASESQINKSKLADVSNQLVNANGEVVRLKRLSSRLEAELSESEVQLSTTKKTLKQAQDELVGVPTVIKNRVAAELARIGNKGNEELENLTSDLANSNQEVERLRVALKESEISYNKMKTQALEATDMAQQSIDRMVAASEAAADVNDINKEIKANHKKAMELATMLSAELNELKRGNAYLTEMMSYQELRTVYEHDDGTRLYLLSTTARISVEENDESAIPDSQYPICYALRGDGCGHLVYIDTAGDVRAPSTIHPTNMIEKSHFPAMREAMTGITVQAFADAVEAEGNRARKMVEYASLLDVDWHPALRVADLMDELERNGRTQEELAEISRKLDMAKVYLKKSPNMVKRFNDRHQSQLVAKVSRNKSKRKKKK